MARPTFSVVWGRIEAHAGQVFETKRGVKFTYYVEDGGFFPVGRNHRVDVSDVEAAYQNVPCDEPSEISQGIREIRGPSFVWAVMHDCRIRQKD